MTNSKKALADTASVQQNILNSQINLFLFDLKNEAAEHGFKTGETWALHMATDAEFAGFKKIHKPLVSLRLQPPALLDAFQRVKIRLQQSLSAQESELTASDLDKNEVHLLVAYPVRSTR